MKRIKRTTPLSEAQRQNAEKIAREDKHSCPDCRSSNFLADRVAHPGIGGFVQIQMKCADCGLDPAVMLHISAEDVAQRLGLDHDRHMRPYPEAGGFGRAPTSY